MSDAEQPGTGAVAVVTGAGRGIGRALALALVQQGMMVVAVDIDFSDPPAAGMVEMRADLANPYSVERLAREVLSEHGVPSLLVNGAVVTPVASVTELPPDEWDRTMAVNLRGPFLMCQAFVPGMVERGTGIVVNLVSAGAMPFRSAYIASKQGLVGLTQSLAAEVGEQGLQVIAFAPGLVDTPGLREAGSLLAPRLGLTLTQFMEMAIPAERAAEAALLLIRRFARDYHGEMVDGHTILERAAAESTTADAIASVPLSASEADTRTRAQLLRDAQRVTARLQAIVDQTSVELSRLPVFARPLAKRGFRRKTGQDPDYWSRALVDLQGHLRQSDRVLISGRERRKPGHPNLLEGLQALRLYYSEAPGESRRFSRDEDAHRYLVEQSEERLAVIDSLVELLEKLGP